MIIYEILRVYDYETTTQYYEEEEKALYDLKCEFKSYVKKFVEEDYKFITKSLYFKAFKPKILNLKEMIELSLFDRNLVLLELQLKENQLDRDMTFKEIVFFWKHLNIFRLTDFFEILKDENLLTINNLIQKIDLNFSYRIIDEEIRNKLNFDLLNANEKELFIQIYKKSENYIDFVQKLFYEIKNFDDIKIMEIGINRTIFNLINFQIELNELYHNLIKEK